MPKRSISMTVRKARSVRPEIGARKLPAAPIPGINMSYSLNIRGHDENIPQITKSILSNASCVRFTASLS